MNVVAVSLEQAEALLGCKRSRVFELLRDGVLERAPRFGRDLRIYLHSIERALIGIVAQAKRTRRRTPQVARPEAVPLQRPSRPARRTVRAA